MKHSYITNNVCPKEITFELKKNRITNVKFLKGGCPGNLQALPRLVENMTVEEVKTKLGGIKCGLKNTSCADQLVKAVTEAYEKEKQLT